MRWLVVNMESQFTYRRSGDSARTSTKRFHRRTKDLCRELAGRRRQNSPASNCRIQRGRRSTPAASQAAR